MSDQRRDALVVDIDGTMAIMGKRGPFEWDRVIEDTPNPPVIRAVRALSLWEGLPVIYCSGRMEYAREGTQTWLAQYTNFPYEALLMRSNDDYRSDVVIKRELYDQFIEPYYRVATVFDDRDKVVAMWRKDLELPCFQVNYGAF